MDFLQKKGSNRLRRDELCTKLFQLQHEPQNLRCNFQSKIKISKKNFRKQSKTQNFEFLSVDKKINAYLLLRRKIQQFHLSRRATYEGRVARQ